MTKKPTQFYKDFIHVFHKICHDILVDKMEKWELDDDIHQSAFIVYPMNIHEECWLMDPSQLVPLALMKIEDIILIFFIQKKGQDRTFNPQDNKNQDSRS